MKRSQKLLLPLALVAGAAVPALAVADDECVVAAPEVTVTPALAEIASPAADRDAAVLSFTASDPDAELRVKLRQDVVRGRGRGRDERAGVRVVEVGEDAYRVSVRKPEGGDVAFTTERVRAQPGGVKLRLRAVVADAEGEPVRSYRATVQVRAVQEVCEGDEEPTTTGEAPAPTTTTDEAPAPAPTTTGEAPAPEAPQTAAQSVRADDDEAELDEEDEKPKNRGRGRGRGGRD